MAKARNPRPADSNKQVITMPEASASPVRKISPPNSPTPIDLEAQIRQRAYELFQERGGASGHENEDWLQAENEILARHRHQQSA